MNPVKVRNVALGEGRPKICVPIVARTRQELVKQADEIKNLPVDVVEWRADWYEEAFGSEKEVSVKEETLTVLAETAEKLREILGDIPLLFTFRTLKEGGERGLSLEDYEKMNRSMAACGQVDLVDLELFTSGERMSEIAAYMHETSVKVIGSSHDFQKTPPVEELVERMCRMQEQGADIAKMAVMPQSKKDVLKLLEATLEMHEQHAKTPVITMSMAGTGTVSRLVGECFGSALTFGAAGKASAPGQVGVQELSEVLDLIHSVAFF